MTLSDLADSLPTVSPAAPVWHGDRRCENSVDCCVDSDDLGCLAALVSAA